MAAVFRETGSSFLIAKMPLAGICSYSRSLLSEKRMDDIDREHDLSHMTREEYLEEIRHIQQLATCPCTECESRCWSTDEITDCELYRRWWDKQNGIRRDYL